MTRSRSIATWAGLAAFALVLSGCTSVLGIRTSQSQSAPKPAPVIEEVDPLPPPAAVDLPGTNGQRVATGNSEARFAYFPGAAQFNEVLAQTVLEQLEINAQAHGTTYQPTVHPADWQLGDRGCVTGSSLLSAQEILTDPMLSVQEGERLAIVCDWVLAAGSHYAQRLRVVNGTPQAPTVDAAEILFGDVSTGEAAAGPDLLSDLAVTEVTAKALEIASSRTPVSAEEQPQSDSQSNGADAAAQLRANVYGLWFDSSGAAVFSIASDFFAQAGLTNPAPLTLRLPPERNKEFLTPLGQGVAASIAQNPEWNETPTVAPGRDYVNCALTPCIAVTFDDGPGPRTPEVVQVLTDNSSAATFFMLGQNVPGMSDVAKQVADAGMEIGNHSWKHPQLTTLSAEGIHQEVDSTNQAILDATGISVTLMRPPYGDYNQATLDTIGMPFVLWSIDTNDWQKPGADELIKRIVTPAIPGDVVLLHDIHDGTVDALPRIVGGLRARGFSLVTVSQLFGDRLQPGNVYHGGIFDPA